MITMADHPPDTPDACVLLPACAHLPACAPGVITMQNPFDMFSISDIIYTERPDLLIETGVVGGSGLGPCVGECVRWVSGCESRSKCVGMCSVCVCECVRCV